MGTQRAKAATDVTVPPSGRPELARHVRLSYDRVREQEALLGPESVVVLNPTGAAVLRLCDGRTTGEILSELSGRYDGFSAVEVEQFLARLVARGWVEMHDE